MRRIGAEDTHAGTANTATVELARSFRSWPRYAPGLYEDYVRFCQLLSETKKLKQAGVTVDELKKAMLADFEETINFLDSCHSWLLYLQLKRVEWATQSAMVPDSSDRLVRYERHLSQEFDNLHRQLERLQRRRLQLSSEFST
jgi:hypothetical protein